MLYIRVIISEFNNQSNFKNVTWHKLFLYGFTGFYVKIKTFKAKFIRFKPLIK